MLCALCADIFLGPFQTGHSSWSLPIKPHYPTLEQLRTSGQDGCELCLRVYYKLFLKGQIRETQIKYYIRGSGMLKEELFFYTDGDSPLRSAEFNILRKAEVDALLSKSSQCNDTSIGQIVTLAKAWINNCVDSHETCLMNLTPPENHWFPTRVVDVGTNENCWEVKLHTTSIHEASGKVYLSLSHTWGEAKFLQLRKDNLNALSQKINFDILPITFQQAIEVTRQLGLQYLWIDSLCIMQDDPSDWRREAALMHQVYRNALCNLAATTGSLQPGLFHTRDVSLLGPIPVSSPHLSFLKADDNPSAEFYLTDRRDFIDDVTNAPLNTRSWVMQERLLSPRILHFSSTQLYFECNTTICCETFPKTGSPKPVLEKFELAKRGGLRDLSTQMRSSYLEAGWKETHELFKRYGRWNKLVESYSACDLSFQGDKLIALSGLAQEMQASLQDSYLAGLWKNDLPWHLLWECTEPSVLWSKNPEHFEAIPYRAPSWSWASVQGEVFLFNFENAPREEQVLVDILDVKVDSVDGNSTGQILGGVLMLRAILKYFKVFEQTGGGARYFYYHSNEAPRAYWPLDIDNKGTELPQTVYLMPVIRSRNFKKEGAYKGEVEWRPWKYFCLVVAKTNNIEDDNEFQRVGYFESSENGDFDAVFELKEKDAVKSEINII